MKINIFAHFLRIVALALFLTTTALAAFILLYLFIFHNFLTYNLYFLKLSAFVTTKSELKHMAAAHTIGTSSHPNAG